MSLDSSLQAATPSYVNYNFTGLTTRIAPLSTPISAYRPLTTVQGYTYTPTPTPISFGSGGSSPISTAVASSTTATVYPDSYWYALAQTDQGSTFVKGDDTVTGASLVWSSTLQNARSPGAFYLPTQDAWQLELMSPDFPFRPIDRFMRSTNSSTMISFSFVGQKVSLLDLKGPKRGQYKIFLDGNSVTVDAHSDIDEAEAYRMGRANGTLPPPIWTSGNLTNDFHQFGILPVAAPLGQQQPELHFYGALVNPDAFEATQTFSTVSQPTSRPTGGASGSSSDSKSLGLPVGVVLGALLLIAITGGLCWWKRHKRRAMRHNFFGKTTEFSYHRRSTDSGGSYASYSRPHIVGGAPTQDALMQGSTADLVSYARDQHEASRRTSSSGRGRSGYNASPSASSAEMWTTDGQGASSTMRYASSGAAGSLSRTHSGAERRDGAAASSAAASSSPGASPTSRTGSRHTQQSPSVTLALHRHRLSDKVRLPSPSSATATSTPLLSLSTDVTPATSANPFSDPDTTTPSQTQAEATAAAAQLRSQPPTITLRTPMPRAPSQVRTRTAEPSMSELVQSAMAHEQRVRMGATVQAIPSRVVVQEQDAGSIHLDSDEEWEEEGQATLPPPYEPRGMGREF